MGFRYPMWLTYRMWSREPNHLFLTVEGLRTPELLVPQGCVSQESHSGAEGLEDSWSCRSSVYAGIPKSLVLIPVMLWQRERWTRQRERGQADRGQFLLWCPFLWAPTSWQDPDPGVGLSRFQIIWVRHIFRRNEGPTSWVSAGAVKLAAKIHHHNLTFEIQMRVCQKCLP